MLEMLILRILAACSNHYAVILLSSRGCSPVHADFRAIANIRESIFRPGFCLNPASL
jgi:hypothetical protein